MRELRLVVEAMSKRVLVCDDLEDTRVLLAELLRVHGYEVVVADNGRAAIDLIRAGELDAALIRSIAARPLSATTTS